MNPRRFLTILFLASALLFFLDQSKIFAAFSQNSQRYIFGPALSSSQVLIDKSVSLFTSLFMVRSFMSDYEKIREERDLYRGQYMELKTLEDENKFLRQALDLEEGEENQFILAQVLSFNPLQPNDTLTINKGERDGVAEGQAVILTGRILVGRVEETSETTSRVILTTSEKSRLTATLENSDLNAIITGSPSGALRLELIKKEAQLYEGELVLSSGLGESIPRNLLIGEISKVISKESASFKEAVVRPFFKFGELRQVFVVK